MKLIRAKFQVDQVKIQTVHYLEGPRKERIHYATVFEREFILESEDKLREAVLKCYPETKELSFLSVKIAEIPDGAEPTSAYVNQD